ncbi:MAG: hypothetical protein WB973_04580 [Thermoanaerobaculia bacterium]
MNLELKANRMLVLNDFLDAGRTRHYSENLRAYFESVPPMADGQCPNSPAVYNFLPVVELLLEKLPVVSEQTGTTLLPTFCYARSYAHGERLAPHRDRPAGEISVTVHLDSDLAWPIHFAHPSTGTSSVSLQPGEAVLYLGCEVTHWRDEYPGQWYRQMTLHYVRSRGKYANACFDSQTPEINGIRY